MTWFPYYGLPCPCCLPAFGVLVHRKVHWLLSGQKVRKPIRYVALVDSSMMKAEDHVQQCSARKGGALVVKLADKTNPVTVLECPQSIRWFLTEDKHGHASYKM